MQAFKQRYGDRYDRCAHVDMGALGIEQNFAATFRSLHMGRVAFAGCYRNAPGIHADNLRKARELRSEAKRLGFHLP